MKYKFKILTIVFSHGQNSWTITHILYMGIISEIIKTLDDLSFWNLLKLRCNWLGWELGTYIRPQCD